MAKSFTRTSVGRQRHANSVQEIEQIQRISLRVASLPPESTLTPSGENATQVTRPRYALQGCAAHAPTSTSHSLTLPSQLPESACTPPGENATEVTKLECPSNVRRNCPVAASQSFNVLSALLESRREPSGENTTAHSELE
jgi:hypothetical protein